MIKNRKGINAIVQLKHPPDLFPAPEYSVVAGLGLGLGGGGIGVSGCSGLTLSKLKCETYNPIFSGRFIGGGGIFAPQ